MNNEEILMGVGSEMGLSNAAEVEALSKALLAPDSSDDMYGTTQTSGGAVTMQDLEGMLVNLTLNMNSYPLWSDINKAKAFSTVEEYDRQIGVGISDGGFVGQMENPEFRDPDFEKKIAIVKFMSEGWQVADVAEATRRLIDRSRVQRAAMSRLLRNLSLNFYSGDTDMISKSFDGLAKTISGESSQQTKDMRGGNVSMNTFNLMGQLITEGNGYVENSKLYVSPAGVQNISQIIESGATSTGDRKIVEMGTNGITIGGKISSIMTAFGSITPRIDKLLGMSYESKEVPQYYDQATSAWIEGSTSGKAPSMPSISIANNATATGSLFSAGTVRPSAVKYTYRVVAKNAYGSSVGSVAVESTSVIAAGGGVTLTITPAAGDSGSKTPECFEIYSEKVGGSGTYRYLTSVAASGLSAVTYADINTYIPGTARMYIIDQTSAGEDRVMAYKQLLPIHNTDLAKMGRFSHGLINLYGVPQYYKPNVLVEIRNIGVDQSSPNKFNTV